MNRTRIPLQTVLALCVSLTCVATCSSSNDARSGGDGGRNEGGSGGQGRSDDDAGREPPNAPSALTLQFKSWEIEDGGRISDFAFVPGSDTRILVLGHRGVLHLFDLKDDKLTRVAKEDFADTYYENGCGLLSVAFDADFEHNGFVYLGRCLNEGETNRISRHVLHDDDLKGLIASEQTVLDITVKTDEDSWHRWGSMGMDASGVLWVFMGEGTIAENAQDTKALGGKLLRIVPNRDPDEGGYEPATGNAFADASEGAPEVYAYGLRSPWRGTMDRHGRYWVGDVGANKIEELNLIMKAGQNFGWDKFEGPCDPEQDKNACAQLTNPIVWYGRTSDEPYDLEDEDVAGTTKRAIWVSHAYERPSTDRYFGLLDDKILFGDYFTGWIRAVQVNDKGKVVSNVFVGHLEKVTACRMGPDGYMYMTHLDGSLHRAMPVTSE